MHITDDCIGQNNFYLNGTCYYVETTELVIDEAIANCQETLQNGRLFEPRDETTHNSVLAAALASNKTLKKSCELANIAAGLSIQHLGTVSISKSDINNAIRKS